MAKNQIEQIRKAKGLSVGGIIELAAKFGHRLDESRFYRLRKNELQPDLEEAHLLIKVFGLASTEDLIADLECDKCEHLGVEADFAQVGETSEWFECPECGHTKIKNANR